VFGVKPSLIVPRRSASFSIVYHFGREPLEQA
jgi:hypothetical protein